MVQQGQVKHFRINNVPGGFAIHKDDVPCATLSALIPQKLGRRLTARTSSSSTTSQLLVIPLPNPDRPGWTQQQVAAQRTLQEVLRKKAFCGLDTTPGPPSGDAAGGGGGGGSSNTATVAHNPAMLAKFAAQDQAALKDALPKLFQGGTSGSKPVEAVQLFLDGRHALGADRALLKQQIAAAVDWLILAAPVACLDPAIVRVVHQLLAVRMFAAALTSNSQFARLQSTMQAASNAVGAERLAPLFSTFELARTMGNAQLSQHWHYHASAAAGQKPSQAAAEAELYRLLAQRCNFDDPAEMAEHVCLHAARAVNLMVNARFQAKVAAVAARVAGCRHFGAAVKGFARSLVKILNDYAQLLPGPGASWVCDGLRCLLTVPSVAAMHALIAILNDEFAGFVQFKNPFELDEAGRAARGHLLLCNITAVYAPGGGTYREMLAWPTSGPALEAMMAETASGQPAERWKRHVAAALALLRDPALADVQVKVAVEIQLTFDSFAVVRGAGHLNYDMVRPGKDKDLWANFGGLEEEVAAISMLSACIRGQLSLVERFLMAPVEKRADGTLLKCGGNVNARVGFASGGEKTALAVAASESHCDVVGYLLKQPGIEVDKASTDDGATPLYGAAQNGFGNVVQQLIAAMADVNKAKTDSGATPLSMAVLYGHATVVQQLLAATADVNHAESSGRTPLIAAAMGGCAEVVRQLLDANADVHQTTNRGSAALKKAREASYTEIVAMLIAAGAT